MNSKLFNFEAGGTYSNYSHRRLNFSLLKQSEMLGDAIKIH
jgi:hypothetical protein